MGVTEALKVQGNYCTSLRVQALSVFSRGSLENIRISKKTTKDVQNTKGNQEHPVS